MSRKVKKWRLIIFIFIAIIIFHIFSFAYISNKSKHLIMSSYDNYGELPYDFEKIISPKDYKRLARRINLNDDSRIDFSTGNTVYGVDYTENYSFEINSVYGFGCFIVVNYDDNYVPLNSNGERYPGSYSNRPCTILWKLSLTGWKVHNVTDVF